MTTQAKRAAAACAGVGLSPEARAIVDAIESDVQVISIGDELGFERTENRKEWQSCKHLPAAARPLLADIRTRMVAIDALCELLHADEAHTNIAENSMATKYKGLGANRRSELYTATEMLIQDLGRDLGRVFDIGGGE
jgi:hypothetical protein